MAIPHNTPDREFDAFDEASDGRTVKRVNIIDPATISEIQNPITVQEIVDPVVVSDIQNPIEVQEIIDPVVVQNIIDPVLVSDIQNPIDVQKIIDPVVVQRINETVAVDQIFKNIYTLDTNLLNGANPNMAVNGAVTPVTFAWTSPQDGWMLDSFAVAFEDDGAMVTAKFGNLAALAKGILIELVIGGVTYTITNVRRNADLLTYFSDAVETQQFSGGSVGGTRFIILGHENFPKPIMLNTGDQVRAVVRDNLSTVTWLQMKIHAMRYL